MCVWVCVGVCVGVGVWVCVGVCEALAWSKPQTWDNSQRGVATALAGAPNWMFASVAPRHMVMGDPTT